MNSISEDPGTVHDEARFYEWLPLVIWSILIIAGIALLVSFAFYLFQFGGGFAASHSRWGEFGDYLGGILNPIFALLRALGTPAYPRAPEC